METKIAYYANGVASPKRMMRVQYQVIQIDHDGYCSDAECDFDYEVDYVEEVMEVPKELAKWNLGIHIRADILPSVLYKLDVRRPTGNMDSGFCTMDIPEELEEFAECLEKHTNNRLVKFITIFEV